MSTTMPIINSFREEGSSGQAYSVKGEGEKIGATLFLFTLLSATRRGGRGEKRGRLPSKGGRGRGRPTGGPRLFLLLLQRREGTGRGRRRASRREGTVEKEEVAPLVHLRLTIRK